MFKFLAILAFVVPAILARTPVRECAGGLPLPAAVHFGRDRENPCLAAPCSISRAGGAGITYVEFTANINSQSIMPRVRARVFGTVTITQVLPAEITNNPCGILIDGSSCPLTAGDSLAYRLELPVDPATPLIPTDTEITLFGDNDQVIFCYQLETTLIA